MIGLALLASVAIARGASAQAAESESQNRIVAVVNAEVITASDVSQAMAPLYGQYQTLYHAEELSSKVREAETRMVTLLIEEKLMLQEARTPRQFEVAKGRWATPVPITVTEEELADAIAQVKSKFPSETEFQQVLTEHHMTLKDLERRYRDQITIQKLVDRDVRSRIVIAPSEVTAYYQAHMDEYKASETVKLSNILIRVSGVLEDQQAKAKAHEIWQALTAGADFAELARKHSEGPNAQGGGGIGWVERGKLMPEIERAVFALSPGQVSPVVRSSLGYHIFRVEDYRPSHTKPIAEIQATIHDQLYDEKFRQRYTDWMAKLKERAYITIK